MQKSSSLISIALNPYSKQSTERAFQHRSDLSLLWTLTTSILISSLLNSKLFSLSHKGLKLLFSTISVWIMTYGSFGKAVEYSFTTTYGLTLSLDSLLLGIWYPLIILNENFFIYGSFSFIPRRRGDFRT